MSFHHNTTGEAYDYLEAVLDLTVAITYYAPAISPQVYFRFYICVLMWVIIYIIYV